MGLSSNRRSASMKRRYLAALVPVLATASMAHAANIFWDGVTGNWTDLVNWSTVSNATTPDPLAIPGSADIAFFNITTVNGAETVYLNGNQSITSLAFTNTGATTLLGGTAVTPAVNTMTLGGSINTGTGLVTIGGTATQSANVNLSLLGNTTFNVGAGGLVINNVVSGAASIAKTGAGLLTLNGANTYNGGTTITGLLLANNSSALGSGAVTINGAAGNQLQLGNGVNLANSITINGGGAVGQGVIQAVGNSTLSGTINITAPQNSGGIFATAGTNVRLTIANSITAAAPVTVRNGYIYFLGAQNYTTGTSTPTAGSLSTLHYANLASMPAIGTVTLTSGNTVAVNVGGAGEFSASGTGAGTIAGLLGGVGGQGAAVVLPAGSSVGIDTTNASGPVTYSNAFTSTNNVGLVKLGSGTLVLSSGGTLAGAGAAGFPFVVRQGKLQLDSGVLAVTGESVVGGTYTTAPGAAGFDAQLVLNGGSLTTTTFLSIGRGNGVGVVSSDVTLNNAASITAGNISMGFNGGSALNLPKGSMTLNGTSSVTVGAAGVFNIAESAGSNMTVTLNDTSSVSIGGDSFVGNAGTGKLVFNGGTYSAGTTALRWMMIGNTGTSSGQVDVNSGNWKLDNSTSIKMSRGNTSGANTINQNGGNVTFYSDVGTTVGGTGALDMMLDGTSTATNTYNLNGGTLTIPAIIASSLNNGTRIFNFNGGVLQAAGTSSSFMTLGNTANSFANVRNLGAIIDTNAKDITINQALIHSNVGGDNAIDGGLAVRGGGSLTLTSNATYTGATTITGNTTFVSKSLAGPVTLTSGTFIGAGTVGATTVANGSNIIGNGSAPLTLASLNFGGAATINATMDSSTPLVVTGALVTTPANGTVTLNVTKVNSPWANGVNNLISFGSFGGNLNNFVLGSLSGIALTTRQINGGLILNGNNIALNIIGDSPKWTGLDSGNWVAGSTGPNHNWKLITAGTATDYIEGDTVLFDDTATGTTDVVINNSNLGPTSTTFNNSTKNYTLSTTSGLGIATGTLTKSGTGTLTISTFNNYTGGTTFTGGQLNINNDTALGVGSLTIAPGSAKTIDNTSGFGNNLSITTQAWNDDFTFVGSSDINMGTGTVTIGGAGTDRTVTVNAGTLSVGELKSATLGFVKLGGGSLVLTTTGINGNGSVIAGTLNVAAGTLQFNQTGAAGGDAVTGDLQVGGLTGAGTIVNGANETRWLFVTNTANNTFSGSLQDGGPGKLGFNKNGTGTMTLSGNNSYSDLTTINAGALVITGPNSGPGTNVTLNAGTLVIGNTTALGGTSLIRAAGVNVSTIVYATDGGDTPYAFTLATGTATTIVSDRASPGAGVTHTMTTQSGANGLGGGTITFTSGANVTSGTGSITFTQLGLGAGSAQTTLLNPTTANVLVGDISKQNNNVSQTIGLGGTTAGNMVTGVISNGAILTGGTSIAVAKSNTSTWTLTGDNTYTGGTTITGGVLNVGNGGSTGSLGTGPVANNAVLNINRTGTVTLSSISGTGSTNVLAGTLMASGTTGSVTVASGITKGLSNNAGQALNVASLTFNGAATVNASIIAPTSPSFVVSGALITNPGSGQVTINAFNPNWAVGIYDLIGFGSFSGALSNFTLGSITGGRVTGSNLVLDGNNIALNITALDIVKWTGALSNEWSTNVLPAPKNWKLQTAGTSTDFLSGDNVLFDDTATTFTVDINSGNVNTTGATFNNNTSAYTLQGSSGIATGTLAKSGSGTLTINNANAFTGGTTFNGGRLNLGNFAALGAGKLTIGVGAPKVLDNTAGGMTLIGLTSQAWNDDFTFAGSSDLNMGPGSVTLGGTGSRIVNVNASILTVGQISGTVGLTKAGAGTLALGSGVASNIGGVLNVQAGTVQINTGTDAAGTNDFISTGLTGSGTVINGGGVERWLRVNSAGADTFSGVLTDGGSGLLGLLEGGPGTLTLTGVNTYTGVTTAAGGVLNFSGAGSILNSSQYAITSGVLQIDSASRISSTANININSDGGAVGGTGRLELSGNTLLVNPIFLAPRNDPAGSDAIRNTSGNNTIGGVITIVTGGNQSRIQSDAGLLTISNSITTTATSPRDLYLQGAGNGLVSGIISDNSTVSAATIVLHKEGAGTWTLTGANTYTGATIVSGGTLVVGDGGTSGNLGTGAINDNATLAFNRSDAVTIATPITGSGGVSNIGTGPLTLTGASNYSGVTNAAVGQVNFSGGITHKVGALRGNTVTIDAGTTVVSGPTTGTSKLTTLTIAGSTGAWTGKLDITNNPLILTATSPANQATLITRVQNQLTSGKAGGTWTGNGITSSTMTSSSFALANSVAIADAGDLNLTAFGGQTVDANSTIVTVAHNGDASLDKKVDALDLNILASHWQQASGALWSSGDFTGDGKVDALDLNILASNWQFGVGGGLEAALASFPVFGGAAAAAVPEPTSLAVLVLGGGALLARRRRRNAR